MIEKQREKARGGRSRTDEEGRGMKEMEAEGAGRCDGRSLFPSLARKKCFIPRGGEREKKRKE